MNKQFMFILLPWNKNITKNFQEALEEATFQVKHHHQKPNCGAEGFEFEFTSAPFMATWFDNMMAARLKEEMSSATPEVRRFLRRMIKELNRKS